MSTESDTLYSKYLLGQLSEEEKLAFEQRLDSDTTFNEAFQEYKAAMIVGQRIHHNEIKDSVSSVIQEERIKNSKLKIRRYSVSAAAVFLLAIAALFIIDLESDPYELYAEFYELPDYGPSRVASDTVDFLELAKINYAKKEWGASIRNIEKVDSSRKALPGTQKLLAHAYLNNNQAVESIALFKNLSKSDNDPSDAWYTGLAFLQIEELDSSLVYLQKVDHSDSFFTEKASKLLRKIQKIKK